MAAAAYSAEDGLVSHSSVRGEALFPMKALCPSVWECQGQEVGVGGLVSREREKGMWEGVLGGKARKGHNI